MVATYQAAVALVAYVLVYRQYVTLGRSAYVGTLQVGRLGNLVPSGSVGRDGLRTGSRTDALAAGGPARGARARVARSSAR